MSGRHFVALLGDVAVGRGRSPGQALAAASAALKAVYRAWFADVHGPVAAFDLIVLPTSAEDYPFAPPGGSPVQGANALMGLAAALGEAVRVQPEAEHQGAVH